MKILVNLMLAIVIMGIFSLPVKAAGLLAFGGEEIIKVADFPDTPEFEYRNGKYIDAGYIYKQVSILYIPVWNYDGRWAGYIGEEGDYLDFTKPELDEMALEVNVKLPNSPTLPFWDAIGGKLLFSLILLLYLGWKIFSSTFEYEENTIT